MALYLKTSASLLITGTALGSPRRAGASCRALIYLEYISSAGDFAYRWPGGAGVACTIVSID